MGIKRFFIAAGVMAVLVLPVGTMGVATISSPARLERFVASIPPEVKAWAKVAWQVLKEGRSVPVLMIDAVARAIPASQEALAERNGKRLLDDGGDVMLAPALIQPASARLRPGDPSADTDHPDEISEKQTGSSGDS